MRKLNKKQLDRITRCTLDKCRDIGLRHARENVPFIRETILDLKRKISRADSAIVISAGPSLRRKDPARLILREKLSQTIVCADGALYYCLRNGLIPDYVVSVDPHPERIVRYFGDPDLAKTPDDDYFRRQDLDKAMNTDEVRRNREIVSLVNRWGKELSVIISTSVTPRITRRCIDAGMKLYWWNPIYDDYEKKGSLTKKISAITGAPCMSTGGNVGTSAWIFANVILQARRIALVGMDLSYPPGTSPYNTQYYHEMKEVFGENPDEGFIRIYNPYLKETWYTDPAYYWYRENFLQLARSVDSETCNCTEGGILFGRGIRFVRLADFLEKNRRVTECVQVK